jgi:putative transposase
LYPTRGQRTSMQNVLDACRWVYNKALEVRKTAWEERGESVSRYDTHNMLPGWKKDEPWLSCAHSQVLQEACGRVELAFQAFWRRCKTGGKPGYPRFKGDWYKSFTFTQFGFGLIDDKHLRLFGVGHVKIRLHRPIDGEIKRLIIKRDKLGNWWACFVVEFDPESLPEITEIVGIDLGLENYMTFSDGEIIENPRFFRKDEKALAKAQTRLSKCEKGSPEYHKRNRVVQHIHQRITNRRSNFAHQLSRRLVNCYQLIVLEDLDIQDMQDSNWRGMNKSISDAAWNQTVQNIAYKAEWAGRSVVLVDPRNTTKMCSRCDQIVEKKLSDRVHRCPHCGLILDRDENAAINILARGLASVGKIPRSPLL